MCSQGAEKHRMRLAHATNSSTTGRKRNILSSQNKHDVIATHRGCHIDYDPSRSPVSYDVMYLPFPYIPYGAMFGWDVPSRVDPLLLAMFLFLHCTKHLKISDGLLHRCPFRSLGWDNNKKIIYKCIGVSVYPRRGRDFPQSYSSLRSAAP